MLFILKEIILNIEVDKTSKEDEDHEPILAALEIIANQCRKLGFFIYPNQ